MPTDDDYNRLYLELREAERQVEQERRWRQKAEDDTREICRTQGQLLEALAKQHAEHIKELANAKTGPRKAKRVRVDPDAEIPF